MTVALDGFTEVRSNSWGNKTHLKLSKPYQTKQTPVNWNLHATSHLEGSGHGPLHLSSMAPAHRVEKNLQALGGLFHSRATPREDGSVYFTRFGVANAESPREICNPAWGVFDVGWHHPPTAHAPAVTAKQTAHEISPSSSEVWGLKYAQLPTDQQRRAITNQKTAR